MLSANLPRGDLRTLSRANQAAATAQPASVPRPRFPWKTRIVVPGAILLALLLLVAHAAQDILLPPRGVTVVPVVVKASAVSIPSATIESLGGATVQAPGWVEADPYPIAVSALADGVVKDVLALEGQSVKAGDVVARLVDDDARLALARTEADLAQKQATLEAAQRDWDNPVERTRAVATGEAMVAQTRSHIEKHHAEVAVEAAKLQAAKEEFERVQKSQQASSEIELIRSRQAFEAQRATLESVEKQAAIYEAELAQRTAELIAAKDNLRLRIPEAKALAEAKAAVALAKATRDEAALRLSRMDVRSPAEGIVMQRLVEPGAKLFLSMDDPKSAMAVRLYNPRKLQVRVDVPLADAAKVGVGQPAQIVVGVLPDRTFTGRVTRIVNEADIQKNTLQVKVAIEDPSPQLKPEMLARVRFTSVANGGATTQTAVGQTVFAPLDLIHRMGDSAMAWVVDPSRSVAVHKTILLGDAQQDGWVAVVSGLSPGDQLIADNQNLRDGERVRVIGEAASSSKNPMQEGARHAAH
jgi:RND family efflux transporter MFP subunit